MKRAWNFLVGFLDHFQRDFPIQRIDQVYQTNDSKCSRRYLNFLSSEMQHNIKTFMHFNLKFLIRKPRQKDAITYKLFLHANFHLKWKIHSASNRRNICLNFPLSFCINSFLMIPIRGRASRFFFFSNVSTLTFSSNFYEKITMVNEWISKKLFFFLFQLKKILNFLILVKAASNYSVQLNESKLLEQLSFMYLSKVILFREFICPISVWLFIPFIKVRDLLQGYFSKSFKV